MSKTKYLPSGTPVRVKWEDAYKLSRTYDVPFEQCAADHRPSEMEDFGRVIFHDPRGIQLAHEVIYDDGERTTRRIKFVPAGMIRSVKVLR